MIIEQLTDLAHDAIKNPKKYNGFMGISIRNHFFSKKNMFEYFRWFSNQFNKFFILLIDDPDRYNLMVFKELSEENALKRAGEISNYTKQGYEKILRGLDIKNITILQFKDFTQKEDYISLSVNFNRFIKSNKTFRDSLFTLMELIIGKKINDFSKQKQLTRIQVVKVKNILLKYTVEEIVPLIYFTEKGFSIEIDPTPEFLAKKLLYEGKFPEFSKKIGLNKRGHIFMYPKNSFYLSNSTEYK